MRVVSTNGCWNIPFEGTSFKRDGKNIQADLPTGKLIVVGEYASEGDAVEAMQSLKSADNKGCSYFQF